MTGTGRRWDRWRIMWCATPIVLAVLLLTVSAKVMPRLSPQDPAEVSAPPTHTAPVNQTPSPSPQPSTAREPQGPGYELFEAYEAGEPERARGLLSREVYAALAYEVTDGALSPETKIGSLGIAANVLSHALTFESALRDEPVPGEQVAMVRMLCEQIDVYAAADDPAEDLRIQDAMRFARQERQRMIQHLLEALRNSSQDAFADAMAEEFGVEP